jgi:RimJ/RimL family protein N-acetyltransferase
LLEGPLRNERNGQLIVERVADGQPIGTVAWHEVHYGPPPTSRAWNIGISLIPEARGQGLGGIAQRLLAEYLFDTTDANRVEASTDVENMAEQRALEKVGFVREGIQRGAQFRAGSHHDLVTYSRLRDEP